MTPSANVPAPKIPQLTPPKDKARHQGQDEVDRQQEEQHEDEPEENLSALIDHRKFPREGRLEGE
jgi:hypothetical protein